MDSITAINILRDNLRTNLTDLYVTAGGVRPTGVNYIFGDEPVTQSKYPIIQLKKIDNPTVPISLKTASSGYWEFEQLFIAVHINVKNGFKVTISSTEYTNAEVVEYLQGNIKTTLKAQLNTLHDAGVKGYKHVNTSQVRYDPVTQLYEGFVTIRVMYFTP